MFASGLQLQNLASLQDTGGRGFTAIVKGKKNYHFLIRNYILDVGTFSSHLVRFVDLILYDQQNQSSNPDWQSGSVRHYAQYSCHAVDFINKSRVETSLLLHIMAQ